MFTNIYRVAMQHNAMLRGKQKAELGTSGRWKPRLNAFVRCPFRIMLTPTT